MYRFKLFLSALTLLNMTALQAQNDFSFGEVTLGGTGCPQGTTSVVKTPDEKAMSFLFDELMVEVPQFNGDNDNDTVTEDNPRRMGRNNPGVAHKVCNLKISAMIPQGQKVVGLDVDLDFRGSTSLEAGVRGIFRSVLIQWKGPRGALFRDRKAIARKRWGQTGPVDEEWTITKQVNLGKNGACSRRGERNVTFNLRNVLMARVQRGTDPNSTSGLITLDSADLAGKLKVKVKTAPCGPQGGNSGAGDLGDDSEIENFKMGPGFYRPVRKWMKSFNQTIKQVLPLVKGYPHQKPKVRRVHAALKQLPALGKRFLKDLKSSARNPKSAKETLKRFKKSINQVSGGDAFERDKRIRPLLKKIKHDFKALWKLLKQQIKSPFDWRQVQLKAYNLERMAIQYSKKLERYIQRRRISNRTALLKIKELSRTAKKLNKTVERRRFDRNATVGMMRTLKNLEKEVKKSSHRIKAHKFFKGDLKAIKKALQEIRKLYKFDD